MGKKGTKAQDKRSNVLKAALINHIVSLVRTLVSLPVHLCTESKIRNMFVFKAPNERTLPTSPVSFCTTFSRSLCAPATLAQLQQLNWAMSSVPSQGICSCSVLCLDFPSAPPALCLAIVLRSQLKHFLITNDSLAL